MNAVAETAREKVAVLLYGMLRTFRTTAHSFHRHVVTPNSADVLYFGPAESDTTTLKHKGDIDVFGNIKVNPKAELDLTRPIRQEQLVSAYGPAMRKYRMHDVKQEEFASEAAAAVGREEWIFGLNPARMFSMMFNVEGAVKLLVDYEAEHVVLP